MPLLIATSVLPLLADHPEPASVDMRLLNLSFQLHNRLPLHLKNDRLLPTTGNEMTAVREIIVGDISVYGRCHLCQAERRIEIVMADGRDRLGGGSPLHLRLLLVEDGIFLEVTIGKKKNRGLSCLLF
jgi:hypothetical protein